MPAVIEAFVDHVPLLLLTADRPPELRFTGANQTIDQVKLFGDAVRWFFDMPAPNAAIDPAMLLTTVDQAVYRTMREPAGPVHINCMFREPLAPLHVEEDREDEIAHLQAWRKSNKPYTQYVAAHTDLSETAYDGLARQLMQVQRGVVVAGKLASLEEGLAVAQLASKLRWPFLADIGSQVRLGQDASGHRIPYFDHALVHESIQNGPQPESVLHVGGRATSKRLLQYLERRRPESFLIVRDHPERFDPRHQVTHSIEAAIGPFANSLARRLQPTQADPQWLSMWQAASERVEGRVKAVLGNGSGLSEPLVARLISEHIPEGWGLFLGSSMPIRDMDMYAFDRGMAVRVGANRGASGIDGTIASAVGFAQGLKRPVTLLLGDLSFLHDLNSLALLRDAALPVVIVVINNDGGGIFSFLPIAQHEKVFEPYFGTPHGLTFVQAAALFKIAYVQPGTVDAFRAAYRTACKRGIATILEVRTEREANKQLHDRLLHG